MPDNGQPPMDDAAVPCFELVRKVEDVAAWLTERVELDGAGQEHPSMRTVALTAAVWLRDITAAWGAASGVAGAIAGEERPG